MNIEKVDIKSLVMNPNNPRVIKDDKFKKLVKSINEFPEMLEIRPIVIDENNIVLGGNMRLKACKEAVTVSEYHRANEGFEKRTGRNKKVDDYDYSFCRYGNILLPAKPFEKAGVITIKCNNPDNKQEIIEFFKWLYDYNKRTKILNKRSISTSALTRKDVKDLLKICIPNIK